MARSSRDPLDGIDRLIVDGTNLLYALRRGPGAAPPAALIGRLRASIPATVRIDLVFDGPPEGLRNTRIASGTTVRFAGSRSADRLIEMIVEEGGPDAGPRTLVATDDRDLRHKLRFRGASTAGAAWLIGRIDRAGLTAPGIGQSRAPRSQPSAAGSAGGPTDDAPDEPARWQPGRGATTKRGNPKRGHPRGGPDGARRSDRPGG